MIYLNKGEVGMSVNILSDKENFRKFINHLRKYIKDDDSYKIYNIYDIVMRYHYRTCYDQGSTLFVHIFKFDDEFEISVSNDELKAIIIILFHKIDKDLFEFFKNGDVNRLHTMINYFKEEGREIYEETCETNDVVNALMKKCTYINENDEYVYKFDNGIQFALNDDDLETIAIVIVDAY